jgi:hypothetical protein
MIFMPLIHCFFLIFPFGRVIHLVRTCTPIYILIQNVSSLIVCHHSSKTYAGGCTFRMVVREPIQWTILTVVHRPTPP